MAHVEEGCLDTIAFQLPDAWTGPVEVSPPAVQETVSDEGERRLSIRPKAAIEGDYQLTIRGVLAPQTPEELRPPALIPAPGEEEASFLLLPTIAAGRQMVWSTTGMQGDTLPAEIMPSSLAGDFATFRIEDATASAKLQTAKSVPGAAASLARVSVLFQRDSAVQGVARFQIHEPRLPQCRLRVPAGIEVLELLQDDLPITPEADGDGWRIALSNSGSGNTVEVVFRGASATGAVGKVVVEAPSLAGVNFARTEWRVYGAGTNRGPRHDWR